MDIKELKYFLTVAHEQNITKAADLLFITQPSLTRQIQNLEKEVGAPLFIRTGKKMILTETGLLLKKRAEEIVTLYEKTQTEIISPNKEIYGNVYIGSGETYAFSTVVRAMVEVRKSYSNIHFHIFSGNTDEVIEKLDNGLIDFGVLVEPFDQSKFDFLRLPISDSWGLLMRKDSPLATKKSLSFEDLENIPLITSRHILNDKHNIINKSLKNAYIVATYNLIYNASIMVKEGLGYALGFKGLINTENSDLVFVPLEPQIISFVDVAWKKNQVFSNQSKLFLHTLQKYLIHNNNYNTPTSK